MPYTYIPKPTGGSYTFVNPQGKEQYDQSSITYDDPTVFYDGVNVNAYTLISKPQGTFYTVANNNGLTGNSVLIGDDSGTEFRVAQPFKILVQDQIFRVSLAMKSDPIPPSDSLTVRIETDNAGAPSGVLADQNSSSIIPSFVDSLFSYRNADFTPFYLDPGITYWIVVSVPDQPNDTSYSWNGGTSPVYPYGSASFSANGGSWFSLGSYMDFNVYSKKPPYIFIPKPI